jgi:hypothetical protein
MKAPNITNYLTNLCHEYEEQGLDGFGVVLSDLLPMGSISLGLAADIGVEDFTEIENSYIDELDDVDRQRISDMVDQGCGIQCFEVLVPTNDDTLVIYLFGMDEQSVLDDLKRRYENLVEADL